MHATHEDVKFTRTMRAVQAELADLASWLELGPVEPMEDQTKTNTISEPIAAALAAAVFQPEE